VYLACEGGIGLDLVYRLGLGNLVLIDSFCRVASVIHLHHACAAMTALHTVGGLASGDQQQAAT
jgi:hypothetical protein